MMKRLPALLLFCLATQLQASETLKQCESSRKTSIAYMRCLDSKLEMLENNKTQWGNNIIFMLQESSKNSGRKGALSLFKKSQKSFTKYAENNCRWQYVSLLPDPTSSAIKYKQCMIVMAEGRILELKKAAKQ